MSFLTSTRLVSCALFIGVLLGICLWPSPAHGDGGFLPTGSMTTPRFGAAAALLPNGKVLIAGGDSLGTGAELYDQATGTFSATGSMSTPRSGATATLLANSKVLVVGGTSATTAELYDPATGSFTPTGSLNASRYGHTATLLTDGKVLIVGGSPGDSALPPQPGNGELYDPDTGTFTSTGVTAAAHYFHAAALLPDGKVLITGGLNGCWESMPEGGKYPSECAIAGAELYDPSTGAFAASGPMINPRFVHTAALLPNGKVLIAAGSISGGTPELYDPSTGVSTVTGTMTFNWRENASATLLPNGKVLIAGGWGTSGIAELYDPASGTFSLSGVMSMERAMHTATLLPNGEVLIAGGSIYGATASAELYRYTISDNVLLVRNVGNGGTVTSSPAGINCGSTCAASFDAGSTVTLTATPDPGANFAGWIGACGGKGTCTVTLAGAASITAMFAAPGSVYMISPPPSGNWLRLVDPGSGWALYSVPITAAGQTVLGGRGLATHPLSGELYALLAVEGTNILQLATIDVAGVASLVGPADDGSGTLNFAAITFDTAGTLYGITNGHALFRIDTSTGTATLVQQIPLGPDIIGPDTIAYNPSDGLLYHATEGHYDDPEGWGTVYYLIWETIDPLSPSSPPLPLPGPCCFGSEPNISKAATALLHRSGDFFLWANYNRLFYMVGTSGSGSFLSTLPAVASGMAPAAPLPSTFPLTVSIAQGSGRVVSTPAGIDCPSTCTASFAPGTLVVLTATADTGYVFDGWVKPDGDVYGSASYPVRMLAARSVQAMFPPAFTLHATKAGNGAGVIRGVGDVDCSATCSVEIAAGRQVYLAPWVSEGSVFAGWSGACTGTNYYCIVTMDADKSVTATFNLSGSPPDTTAPTVALTAPANGSTVSGSAVSVSATATDDVGVVGVQFMLDGTNLGVEVSAAPYLLVWNATQAANGAHTITADARDAAGNHGTSTISVTVQNAPPPDTTAPTVAFTGPTNGSTVSGSAATILATASDDVGVVGVQFKLDGINLGAEVVTAPYSLVWDTTQVANGIHTLTADARDAAGNHGTATVSVTVNNPDVAAPTVLITSHAAGSTVSGASVTVTADATDNVGVVGVQFKLDGANLGAEDTTAPYAITWDTTKTANGSHLLTANARDAAGNIGVAVAVTVTVNNSTDFKFSPDPASPTAVAVTAGSAATYKLNIAPTTGFTGTISFTCTGAPAYATCSVSPNPVNVSGASGTEITVTVTTTAKSSYNTSLNASRAVPGSGRPGAFWAMLMLPTVVFLPGAMRRRRWPWLVLVVVAILALALLSGCGDGNAPQVVSGGFTWTKSGTYPIVVSGTSGTVRQTYNLSLTVN